MSDTRDFLESWRTDIYGAGAGGESLSRAERRWPAHDLIEVTCLEDSEHRFAPGLLKDKTTDFRPS